MTAAVSDWEPGDVAMVSVPGINDAEVRMIRAEGGWDDGDTSYWDGAAGPWLIAGARPLVVIDPEDAEQVERLRVALDTTTAYYGTAGYLQACLREFANPTPRIEEPLGLGAVVEDAEGVLWLRADDPPAADWNLDKPWRGGPGYSIRKNWQIVDAVRVLSEGVPS